MFLRIPRALGAAIFFPSLASLVWAQPLTLPEAQALAAGRSQQLVASDAAATAVREMAIAAGQLPDPVLKLGVENVPLSGPERFSLAKDFMTMRRIGLMQELTRSDKRRLKVERVQREGQRLQAERQMALAEIQRETALAWIERAYSQAMLELVRAQLAESQLQIQAAELAFQTARGATADVFGARVAVASLQDKLRQTERQNQSATLMLARWIGGDAAARPPAGAVHWQGSGVERVIEADHLRRHPHLAVLQAQVQAAETEVQQAQANTRPDWTVEAMYSQRGSAYSNMVSIGVSIPLQWDRGNRQDREVAAKVAMLAEARAKLEDALRAEEARVRVLLNDWQAGKLRLQKLTAELLPAASNRAEAAAATYRTGKADLASALSARRDEIDARMQVLALEMEVARLFTQLNFLIPDLHISAPAKDQP